jgi:glucoamylase
MEIVHAGAGNTNRITLVELHQEPARALGVSEALALWIERQYRRSAVAMMRSISPVGIVKHRPGFAQTVRPRKGSIVASPVLGAYDPEPDYFFHWYRDSAVVVDALRLLFEDASVECAALAHFGDFVRFSLSLQGLDGRSLSGGPDAGQGQSQASWRNAIAPDFRQYVRTDEDLAAVQGEAVAGETRVNPDGTLDLSKWPRPQYDGPSMRAITLLRWRQSAQFDPDLNGSVDALLRADLEFTRRHWREACFDIWEEEKGLHYYTLRVAAAALDGGAGWFELQGERAAALACRADAAEMLRFLDGYWREDLQFYRSRMLEAKAPSGKELDIAVIFAALHAAGSGETHSVRDPRMHATLAKLETLFDAEYAINRNREDRAPAMGRYAGDVYYSGGAYYFSTLAAAEFCYRAALEPPVADSLNFESLVERGDAFLETVRRFTPPSGDLSEQFDQQSGVQRSAQQLAWSYAAFISCVAARRQVIPRGA